MLVIGVGGKTERWLPDKAADEVFGPSGAETAGLMAREDAFLWPRRKALADGGGRGSTFSRVVGGDGAFFGGVKERVFSPGGGEMLKLGLDMWP